MASSGTYRPASTVPRRTGERPGDIGVRLRGLCSSPLPMLLLTRIQRLRIKLVAAARLTDAQTILLWAALAGLVGALATMAFRESIRGLQWLVTGHDGSLVEMAKAMPWYLRLAFPAIGGVIAGAFLEWARRGSKGRSNSDYMEAISIGDGRIDVRESVARSVSSLFSVASGGSIGREGSMVQLAATCASIIGRLAHFNPGRLRLLVACGAAAGITSAYNAPIAGALFVAEIVVGSIAMESFGPMLVASPGYFSGTLTLGGLMVVVGAFNQVQSSLRWFVDQFPSLADWRATLHRVSAFKAAMDRLDRSDETVEHIRIARHPRGKLAFDGVSVLFADGRVVIAETTVEIALGERVLIVGESGAGKSTLFRALAGLWPWGTGTILLPDPAGMMFMPQRPYLPLGTLRAALTYPDAPNAFSTAAVEVALKRVGLAEFQSMLDVPARLDKSLSLGQQQLIGFARLLLHRPKWVFLDEATSALDELSQKRVMSILDQELEGATMVSIGHRPGLEAFHRRVLHLVRSPLGATLRHGPVRNRAAVPA